MRRSLTRGATSRSTGTPGSVPVHRGCGARSCRAANPSFVIDGQRIVGAQPFATFAAAIDAALARANAR